MKYFRDQSGGVHAFDESEPAQFALMKQLTTNWMDITGAWPPVPNAAEIQQQKFSALDAEYQPQFTQLSQALGMATLADNSALITSTKAEYVALRDEYDKKRGEISGS